MKKQQTVNKTVDLKVGELILSSEDGIQLLGQAAIGYIKEVKNKNFTMLFETKRTGIFEIDFLFYLINHAMHNVVLYHRDERLAKEFDVTRPTIERMKMKLRDGGLIKYNIGVIMLNPLIFFKGSASARNKAIISWHNFEEFREKRKAVKGDL